MLNRLKTEKEFFKRNQAEFAKRYPSRYIAIKGEQVTGAYDSPVTAFKQTVKNNKPGTFLIQHCLPIDVS